MAYKFKSQMQAHSWQLKAKSLFCIYTCASLFFYLQCLHIVPKALELIGKLSVLVPASPSRAGLFKNSFVRSPARFSEDGWRCRGSRSVKFSSFRLLLFWDQHGSLGRPSYTWWGQLWCLILYWAKFVGVSTKPGPLLLMYYIEPHIALWWLAEYS